MKVFTFNENQDENSHEVQVNLTLGGIAYVKVTMRPWLCDGLFHRDFY